MAQILNGIELSQKIENNLKNKIIKLEKKPRLDAILVGNDSRSSLYVDIKRKKCSELGIEFRLHNIASYKEKTLLELINKLNIDNNVTGILLQLPLPNNEDPTIFFNAINPKKDVDGVSPLNIGNKILGRNALSPCTPKGIISLLQEYNIKIKSQDIVVIGASYIVGKPLSRELLNLGATVTTCHINTKNLIKHTIEADIVISATGHKNLITNKHVKQGATVIDVGITKSSDGSIAGDVDFHNIKNIVKNITVHPGGVGPMTVVSLMENILEAYKLNN